MVFNSLEGTTQTSAFPAVVLKLWFKAKMEAADAQAQLTLRAVEDERTYAEALAHLTTLR